MVCRTNTDTDTQYETVLAVLYASYIPAQLPSNMILNRITRHVICLKVCSLLTLP